MIEAERFVAEVESQLLRIERRMRCIEAASRAMQASGGAGFIGGADFIANNLILIAKKLEEYLEEDKDDHENEDILLGSSR